MVGAEAARVVLERCEILAGVLCGRRIPDLARELAVAVSIRGVDRAHADREAATGEGIVLGHIRLLLVGTPREGRIAPARSSRRS